MTRSYVTRLILECAKQKGLDVFGEVERTPDQLIIRLAGKVLVLYHIDGDLFLEVREVQSLKVTKYRITEGLNLEVA